MTRTYTLEVDFMTNDNYNNEDNFENDYDDIPPVLFAEDEELISISNKFGSPTGSVYLKIC